MSRNRKVSLHAKGKTWYARFYDHNDIRRFVSLQININDVDKAESCKRQIESLQLNHNAPCDSRVHEIFFGEEKTFNVIDKINTDDEVYLIIQYQNKIKELQDRIKELELFEIKYNAIMKEEWARRISSLQSLPSEVDLLDSYYKHIEPLDRQGNAYKTAIKELRNHSGKTISEIECKDIYDYLEKDQEDRDDPQGRWNKERNKLFHFYSWMEANYRIVNIINYIETKRVKAKSDPKWHSIEEVEEVASKLPLYWQTIIRFKAYSGIGSKELRGMRVKDFYKEGDNHIFRVTPHHDRGTKSSKRVRNVIVHPTRLLPTMNEYMKTKRESEYLFPSIIPGSEMWEATAFSKNLNSHLPDNMDALSLRRTFGSLLIRSGKTEVQVSAAMGNSPEMVRKYYARILGDEVQIDF